MITEQDLQAAIAECQGQRNPTASTCIKLAAFFTIKEHMYPESNSDSKSDESGIAKVSGYSYSAYPVEEVEDTIVYKSDTEFSKAIYGKAQSDIFPILDELMDVIQSINPRLYNGVMRKING